MKFGRTHFAIVFLLLVAAGLFWILNSKSSPVLVSNVYAVPINDDVYAIYLSMDNPGGPDIITGVTSEKTEEIYIMAGSDHAGLAIPAGSKPLFSPDGAHIMAQMNTLFLAEGTFIPFTLNFARGGEVPLKAIVKGPNSDDAVSAGDDQKMDHANMDHSMHDPNAVFNIKDDQTAPQVRLDVTAGDNGQWLVTLQTENFEFFEPDTDNVRHKDGQGHGHLYLNGLKLQRMYDDHAIIGALPKGRHVISVTLNTNDHRAYALNSKPIYAFAEIEVK